MLPFHELLKPSTPFYWDDHLNTLFEKSKSVIIEDIWKVFESLINQDKPVSKQTGWRMVSASGSFKNSACTTISSLCYNTGWEITVVGSQFTHPADSRCALIKRGKALAVTDALSKARHFVLGCDHLIIVVDHKLLIKPFGDRLLSYITNSRLRNIKEKTLHYRFKMIYIPGVCV